MHFQNLIPQNCGRTFVSKQTKSNFCLENCDLYVLCQLSLREKNRKNFSTFNFDSNFQPLEKSILFRVRTGDVIHIAETFFQQKSKVRPGFYFFEDLKQKNFGWKQIWSFITSLPSSDLNPVSKLARTISQNKCILYCTILSVTS